MNFIKDVSKEMNKVTWLSKKDVLGQFLAVHVIGAIIIGYFAAVDLVVNVLKSLF